MKILRLFAFSSSLSSSSLAPPSKLSHTSYTLLFLLWRMLILSTTTAAAAKLVQNNNGGERITGQRFAMEPQDQTAIVGSRVTLPCRVIEKQGTLQVSKNTCFTYMQYAHRKQKSQSVSL